ncbi:hypothetical protein CF328_g8451, partial [Tilletia controversa]
CQTLQWVAGPHPDGHGSYLQPGDDVSQPYLRSIANSVGVLYGKGFSASWLDGLALDSQLVDYQ